MNSNLKKSLIFLCVSIFCTAVFGVGVRWIYDSGIIYDKSSVVLLKLSQGFQIKQVITVVLLYIWGNCLLHIWQDEKDEKRLAILAFPFSVASWCVGSFLILIFGIPYNLISMLILGIMVLSVSALIRKKTFDKDNLLEKIKYFNYFMGVTCIASVGLFFTSALSDVFYYNYQYGKQLAILGAYDGEMMLYSLTRVGQMSPLLSSLAYFGGFDNINTINHMMMISMGCYLFNVLHDSNRDVNKKFLNVVGVIGLLSMTPYILMAGMVSNNTMEMFAIIILSLGIYELGKKEDKITYIICVLFAIMTAMGRVEGGVYLVFLIGCSVILSLGRKKTLLYIWLPAVLIQTLYYMKLFVVMGIQFDEIYFVTEENLIINLGVFAIGGICIVLIYHPIFKIIKKRIGVWIIGALIGINVLELLLDSDKYIYNIQMVLHNIFENDKGWQFCVWGITPWIVVCTLLLVAYMREITYFDLIWIGYVLLCVGVCWFREPLRSGFGDSANRMLMMILPIVVISFVNKVSLFKNDNSNMR